MIGLLSPAKAAIAAAFVLGPAAVLAADANDVTFYSAIEHCPEPCVKNGPVTSWTAYHHVNDLNWCKKPMLFSANLYTPIDDPETDTSIFACTTEATPTKRRDVTDAVCANANATIAEIETAWKDTPAVSNAADVVAALQHAQSFLADAANCNDTTIFSYSNGSVVGIYAGKAMQNSGAASTIVQKLLDRVQKGVTEQQLVQVCGQDRNADYVVGVVADASGKGLNAVQSVLKGWSDAKCATGLTGSDKTNSSVWQVPQAPIVLPRSFSLNGAPTQLSPRADCTAIQVVSGDGCGSLASKCGISASDFTKYNSAANMCANLMPGQWVCCSSGTLPDKSPKQNSDGSCHSYTIIANDNCANLAASYSLTKDKIETFNKNTWGWMGCDLLYVGTVMCLSDGTPPFPAPLSNALCGPQMPNTTAPAPGSNTNISTMNPCPLNACCDIWGQCGTTSEFCTAEKGPAGAPGTAPAGHNGCISNCGTDIIKGSGGGGGITLGYFEAWNMDRPCLNMDISNVANSGGSYSHVHFAFASITADFQINITTVQDQFNRFKTLGNDYHKVVSFGGWSFSTDLDSYPIFRNTVTAANRLAFARNVVSFLNDNNLDGVDFDWEYPGAPDIPGIPPGSPDDGPNYLMFLKILRQLMPTGKTISIAAPASYWYLKGFPIKDMAPVLDYIVYMTYDLHGQWDYDNKWANPGCPTGNCLRSHVNMTETLLALSMITKAGVPAGKVVVGVSSYGRSFGMTDPSCTGVECTFTGPDSGATPGDCTQTAGYISNSELLNAAKKRDATSYFDEASNSDILVYNGNWVAYMSDNNKASRKKVYGAYGFAGSTDWAVDLQKDMGKSVAPTDGDCTTWKDVPCTSNWVATATQAQDKRWTGVGSKCAWSDFLNQWQHGDNGGFSFSNTASENFFKGRDSMECGKIKDHSNCDTSYQCMDNQSLLPAGYFILSSFVNTYNMHANLYGAIGRVESQITTQIATLASKFAPPLVEPDALKIALDIVAMCYTVAVAPMWNSYLKGFALFSSDDTAKNFLGTLKDTVNGLVSGSLTLIKDSSVAGQVINSQNSLEADLGQLVGAYAGAIEAANEMVFKGDDTGIGLIWSLIDNGAMLEPGEGLSDLEIQGFFAYAIFGTLIPRAWNTVNYYPVILDTGYTCDNNNVDDLWLDDGDANSLRVCVNSKQYYLVVPFGDGWYCYDSGDGEGVGPCYDNNFSIPPGVETMDGKAWEGLTVSDLVTSAVKAYIANGNKNGWGPPDLTNEAVISDIYDNGIKVAGFVPIPVCSAKEAHDNWAGLYTPNPQYWNGYPCNKI